MKAKRFTAAHQSMTFSRRMMLVGGAQAAFGGILIARLGYLSVAQNQHYQLLSESNRVRLNIVPPRRGWIVDRAGKPIAINRSDFRVDIIPEQLEHPTETLRTLTEILKLTPDDVDRIIKELKASHGYQPVQVAENVPYDQYAAITVRLPEMPGVQPQRGFSRFYPAGPAVAHLVGYVGAASAKDYEKEKNPLLITPGFKIGKEGLEKTLETQLRGTPGGQRVELTARGKLVRELTPKPDRSGGTVKLTIDAGLQEYAARRLGDQSGSVVVVDCHTGDILAFVSMPAFDPNSFSQGIGRTEWKTLSEDDHLPLLNKVTQGLYPSGSTIKPLMSLAFLEAGIDPNRHVVCTGSYRVGNGIFHCDKVHGSVDMHTAIEKSCDIYFYATGLKAGPDVIASMARRLGFGQQFDLPLTSQRFGTVPDPQWMERKYHREWQAYDTINMSIGQGNILVNPLQLAIMAGRIASGKSIQPRLIIDEKTPPVQPLPVSPEHLAFVRDAMSAVVNSGRGTASVAKLPIDGVLLAGKTGTAQVRRITMAERAGGVRSNESLGWKMRDHSLFVGFAPAGDPRYACGVIVEHGGWGAAVAAPICRDTLTFLYDPAKAMAALAPYEEQWGGTLAERTARRAAAIETAAKATLAQI
jgi:penicillin-binding protein 2